MSTDVTRGKETLREVLLTRRRGRSSLEREEAARALALHAESLPVLVRARRVAGFLSMSSEPGTALVLQLLVNRGVSVIVPVTGPDRTLDWVAHTDAESPPGDLGVPEPAGERLGADALAACDVAIVPALAVDHHGNRLGRGAGYYDRALAEFDGVVCALVFDDELLPEIPHEPHDHPVDLVLTPAGVFRPDRG